MLRAIVLTAAMLTAPCVAYAQPCVNGHCPAVTQQAAQEQVALPRDQSTPYLTIIGSPSDPRTAQLTGWFEDNAALRALKSQTKYHVVTTDSAVYKERYASTCRGTPCVRLQDGTGRVVPGCELVGDEIPMTPEALAKAIGKPAATQFGTRESRPVFDRLRNRSDAQPAAPELPPAPPEAPVVTVPGEKPVVLANPKSATSSELVSLLIQLAVPLLLGGLGSAGTTNAILIGAAALYYIRERRKMSGKKLLIPETAVDEILGRLKDAIKPSADSR